jgi:archaemetzincin
MEKKPKKKFGYRFFLLLLFIIAIFAGALIAFRIYTSRSGPFEGLAINPHPGLGKMIYVLPVGVVKEDTKEYIRAFLAEQYRHPAQVLPPEPIPNFIQRRDGQLNADGIRRWLKQKKGIPDDAFRFVAITENDIYSEGYNFIFGQADVGGLILLLSLHRLDPAFDGGSRISETEIESLFTERVRKLTRHELGHTFGLPHCPNNNCVMVFHNSLDALDRGGEFYCEKCLQLIMERNPSLRNNLQP